MARDTSRSEAGSKAALTKKRRAAATKAAETRRRKQARVKKPMARDALVLSPTEPAVLEAVERHFHVLIRQRAAEGKLRAPVDLPRLASLGAEKGWFPVPGMYGGFSYRWDPAAKEMTLVAESWCRVVEGSGQRHLITASGATLVAQGFV